MTDSRRAAARTLSLARWGQREPSTCKVCGAPVTDSEYRDYCGQAHYRRARRAKRKEASG